MTSAKYLATDVKEASPLRIIVTISSFCSNISGSEIGSQEYGPYMFL